MFDGREVSELERQFLFSWKAMRKARHRYQQQMISNNNVILKYTKSYNLYHLYHDSVVY